MSGYGALFQLLVAKNAGFMRREANIRAKYLRLG